MSSAYEASMYRKGESSDAQTSWLSLFLIDLLKLLICAAVHICGVVVATLAAVEHTNPDISTRFDAEVYSDKPNIHPQARLSAPASHKPITTKLRTTIRHLRARAGFWSPFRGFEISLISSFTLACLLSFTRACSSSILVEIVAQFCIGMLLAPWKMLLVHLVISEPSPKCFYQRIPGYRAWIKIAPAAAFQEIPISAYKLLQRAIETVNWFFLAIVVISRVYKGSLGADPDAVLALSGRSGFTKEVLLPPSAATAAQVLVAVAGGLVSICVRNAFTSSCSFSFCSRRMCWLCLTSWSSCWVAAMVAVWWWMTSFSVPISFHTSLVVIRPAGSEGPKASPLRVRFRFSTVVLVSRSSPVKLSVVFCMFVGGLSGSPACGSDIGQGLVPARYTTSQFCIKMILSS